MSDTNSQQAPLSGKLILLVDDSPAVRTMLASALSKAGATIMVAEDGQYALDMIAKDQPNIDLIFCDINMPRKNGIEFVQEYAAVTANNRAKVIMLTAESNPEYIKVAKAAGVVGWLLKPVTPEHAVSVATKLTMPKAA